MALTYPATLADLRGRVQSRLQTKRGGTATDHWDDDRILEALNRAQLEVQTELLQAFKDRWFVRREDFTPSNNVILLPQDLIRIISFVDSSGRPVEMVPVSRAAEYRNWSPLVATGSQLGTWREVWMWIGDRLENQATSSNGSPYTIYFNYRIPDLQADEDVSEIPPQYQEILVDHASYRLAKDAKQDELAASIQADYEKALALMKQSAVHVNPTASNRVRRVYNRRTPWVG